MSKFKVAFNLDLSQIAPEALMGPGEVSLDTIQEVVAKMLLSQARKAAKDKLHSVRRDATMDPDVKVIQMADQIRKMMITLMAEANMSVEKISDDTVISTELPFEKNYREEQERHAA